MMFRGAISIACALLCGCGQSNSSGAAPSASTSASSAPVKPTVTRKITPAALRAADEQACLAGKADACRGQADRYRGYGHPAGCGLERAGIEAAHGQTVESMPVRIKRTFADEDEDNKSFLVWIAKACDLGDSNACMIEGAIREKRQPDATIELEAIAMRSDPKTSAVMEFHALWAPDEREKVIKLRNECYFTSRGSCSDLAQLLMTRVKQEKRPPLTPEIIAKLQAIGELSLDFDALVMMLDKHGYTTAELAPLAEHARKTLVQACIEGACVCGDAAQSLPEDDPRVPDLARWGCENGEAKGCYMLGKLHEEGKGVEKDELFARSLYELACPPARSRRASLYAEVAPGACGKLAEMAEGGATPPKDLRRAVYYWESACRNPGYERDHSHCVKLGKYWTTGVLESNCNSYNASWCRTSIQEAEDLLYGPKGHPAEAKECERPSVKAACDAVEPALESMRKLKGVKK